MNKTTERIYLSPPHIGVYEQQLVAEAFKSNWIAPLGPHVEGFEKELSEYVGVRGALALNSGTAAIHLALRILGVGPGDNVFCSTLTFVASANPIIYQGAKPVFIDSEPESWNMSPIALEKAFRYALKTKKLPKAVIIVNLYGQSANMDALLELCNHYKVPVIEDAAESLGATYKGKASGAIGLFGIYSFNGNKIITTSGGGMLVSNDLEALEKARFWATQARDPAPHYQHSEVGYNYRMSNILAAVGRGQLRVLDERIKARRTVFERYYRALSEIAGFMFMPEADYGKSTRWLTSVLIEPQLSGVTTKHLLDELAAKNIEARPVWKPLHLQPLFNACDYYYHGDKVSIADRLFEKGICLPSGSNMNEQAQALVIDCIKKTVAGYKKVMYF